MVNGLRSALRHLLGLGLAFFLALTLLFVGLRLVPGDAMLSQLIEAGAPDTVVIERRAALGLDQPLGIQYLDYVQGLATANFGVSLLSGLPVSDLIAAALPHTLALAGSAWALGMCGGLILAIALARAPRAGRVLAQAGVALGLNAPVAATGALAVALFSTQLNWFPGSGAGTPTHLVLPSFVLAIPVAAAIGQAGGYSLRHAYASMPILAARSRGLTELLLLRHVLRLVLPTLVVSAALQAAFLLGGTAITEALFARPGLGRLMVDAALNRDFPIVQGVALWSAGATLVITSIADIIIRISDPQRDDETR